ncbi:glycosyltransferase family 4 protein [Roseimaritima ulvae]|uniref:D-inositol-3-phosphate glycosyltransferase n=1 Tax=Roseimaritima ulvae TaxID=980254 RepID=A0A5B9R0P4_9BACT|nr:glycosyltransferase family 4 protein [Roseimaritima ulvae]QEG42986.1 D-inositol-3-phosphate glycosyltransferase [Roseimaritima ulvae]
MNCRKNQQGDDRPHVCIVTSAHPVDDVRLYAKLASSFLEDGMRVSWVGPDYHYCGTANGDTLRDIQPFLFPRPKSRLHRLTSSGMSQALEAVGHADVYLAAEPDSAKAACEHRNRFGGAVIFDIHELYHQSHITAWVPRPLLPMARRALIGYMKRLCSKCDAIVGVSDGVLEPYWRHASKHFLVRNCAGQSFGSTVVTQPPRNNRFTLMHGKSTEYNGTSTVLEALALVADRIPELSVIMFDWWGEADCKGRDQLLQKIQSLSLERCVDLRKPVPFEQMEAILKKCDVGMIAHGRSLAAGTQPNRAYEYMACSLPMLVPIYDDGIAPVVAQCDCGLCVDFEDPVDIAKAILDLYEDKQKRLQMADRGRQAFVQHYNWSVEVQPLLKQIRRWYAPKEGGHDGDLVSTKAA